VNARGVPPLLRHYVRLGARSLGLSVDPVVGGSVDALIVVDLAAAPRAILERYLGREAARVLQVPGRNASWRGLQAEQPPRPEREEESTVGRVLEDHQHEGARAGEGPGQAQPSDGGQGHAQPVAIQ